MKGLIILCCLFLSINALAQSSDTIHKDISGGLILCDAKIIPDKPLVVFNGYIYKGELNINSDSIFNIELFKGDEATALFGSEGLKGVIFITTKQYAISQYQKKLSSFSANYKKYVEFQMKFNHNDNGILYVILKNGEPLLFKGNQMIRALNDLPAKSISKVELNKKETCCGTNVSVTITTNQ